MVPLALISYHRTIAPAPPEIECAVQMVVAPNRGSKLETACSSRPSSVSSLYEVPGCGAIAGARYDDTEIVAAAETSGVPALFVIVKRLR